MFNHAVTNDEPRTTSDANNMPERQVIAIRNNFLVKVVSNFSPQHICALICIVESIMVLGYFCIYDQSSTSTFHNLLAVLNLNYVSRHLIPPVTSRLLSHISVDWHRACASAIVIASLLGTLWSCISHYLAYIRRLHDESINRISSLNINHRNVGVQAPTATQSLNISPTVTDYVSPRSSPHIGGVIIIICGSILFSLTNLLKYVIGFSMLLSENDVNKDRLNANRSLGAASFLIGISCLSIYLYISPHLEDLPKAAKILGFMSIINSIVADFYTTNNFGYIESIWAAELANPCVTINPGMLEKALAEGNINFTFTTTDVQS